MDLEFAVALDHQGEQCRVKYLNDDLSQDAAYSPMMIERAVWILPGDLLAVDRHGDVPTIYFRWRRTTVVRLDGNDIYTDPTLSTYQPQVLHKGLDVVLAPGDRVYIAFGEVHDVCVGVLPSHLEQLRAEAFPEIEAMYR